MSESEIDFYQRMEHPLSQEILKAIDMEKKRFIGDDRGNCPLLTKDGWCRIVLECGEECLSSTCKTYPRGGKEFGDIIEYGVDITCPKAASFLLQQEEILFDLEEYTIDSVNPAFDYESYDAHSAIRNFLIDLWGENSESINEVGKYYLTLHLYYNVLQLEQNGEFSLKLARELIDTCSTGEALSSFSDVASAILKDKASWMKVIHSFFAETGNFVLGEIVRILGAGADKYDIALLNQWLGDRDLFQRDIEAYMEWFRGKSPGAAERYFVYILFHDWMQKEEKSEQAMVVLNSLFLTKVVEWFWIQILAAVIWKKYGRVDELETIISEIDRPVERIPSIKEGIKKKLQELGFDRKEKMLFLAIMM